MLDSAELRTEPWPGRTAGLADLRMFLAADVPKRASGSIRLTSLGVDLFRSQIVDHRGRELMELPFLTAEGIGTATVESRGAGPSDRRSLSDLLEQGNAQAPPTGPTGPWEVLASHHVEHCCRWGESSSQLAGVHRAEGTVHVTWGKFLDDYWEPRDEREPPRHLIVVIAQECSEWIVELCHRPRRILRRERQQVPVNHAQDLDDACIRWLSRQPGRRLVDRAGPRQRLMAVIREESFDTAENRVLRDFLRLSRVAAHRYLAQFTGYADSRRIYDVRLYLARVERLLKASPIARVPRLVGAASRNYVLQFDPRYSRLWQWYERLRRQEDDRDDLSPWRHRTWAEYCELLLASQCEGLRRDSGSFQRPVVVRHEADHGKFLDCRWTPGPWSLQQGNPMELVRLVRPHSLAMHACTSVRRLGALAPDLVLTVAPVFDEAEVRTCMAVWTIFASQGSEDAVRGCLHRAASALGHVGDDRATGLLLLPSSGTESAAALQRDEQVTCILVGLPESQTLGNTRGLLANALTSLVSGRSR